MATLYELTPEYINLLEMAQDPSIDQNVIQDTMEGIMGEIEAKADNYVIVMKELEAEAEKLSKEIERLTKRKNACTESIEHMKLALKDAMRTLGKSKLETEHFKLSIAKNGGIQPTEIDEDVPTEYCKLVPDKERIRADLLFGKKLSFARLAERGTHLNIR